MLSELKNKNIPFLCRGCEKAASSLQHRCQISKCQFEIPGLPDEHVLRHISAIFLGCMPEYVDLRTSFLHSGNMAEAILFVKDNLICKRCKNHCLVLAI